MVEIRLAGREDIPGMARVYVQSWQKAYRGIMPDAFLDGLDAARWSLSYAQSLGKPGAPLAGVLVKDAQIAGVTSFGKARDDDAGEGWGEVISLYLLKENWGKGLGAALLTWAVAQLKQAGYTDCIIWVLKDNFRARRLYEKLGFRCLGTAKVIEVAGVDLEELRYVRRL